MRITNANMVMEIVPTDLTVWSYGRRTIETLDRNLLVTVKTPDDMNVAFELLVSSWVSGWVIGIPPPPTRAMDVADDRFNYARMGPYDTRDDAVAKLHDAARRYLVGLEGMLDDVLMAVDGVEAIGPLVLSGMQHEPSGWVVN